MDTGASAFHTLQDPTVVTLPMFKKIFCGLSTTTLLHFSIQYQKYYTSTKYGDRVCLDGMKRKVEEEEYASAQEFADDLAKMFDHTEMYFLVSAPSRLLENPLLQLLTRYYLVLM